MSFRLPHANIPNQNALAFLSSVAMTAASEEEGRKTIQNRLKQIDQDMFFVQEDHARELAAERKAIKEAFPSISTPPTRTASLPLKLEEEASQISPQQQVRRNTVSLDS